MNQHSDEAASDLRSVWQRPGWYLIQGARAPEAQAEADEQASVHQKEQVVDAWEEVKRTGNALVLHCVHPQHVPNLLDSYGEECIREQRGDAAISAKVAFEAGWWTSTVEIRYRWDQKRTNVGLWASAAPGGGRGRRDHSSRAWLNSSWKMGSPSSGASYSQSVVRAAHP